MSESLLLINPRRRRRRKTASKRRTTRRRTRRASTLFAANPVRRRRRTSSRRRSNPIARRRRRNPISMGGMKSTLMDAFKGAAGAVAVNFGMRQLAPMLPAALTTGYARYATRAGMALALGMFGSKLVGGSLSRKMAEGAMTVIATDFTREIAAGQGIDLSGTGYYQPALQMQLPMKRAMTPGLTGTGAYTRIPGVPLRAVNGRR